MKYGVVTWISELLTSNGRSKCRSLRTNSIASIANLTQKIIFRRVGLLYIRY